MSLRRFLTVLCLVSGALVPTSPALAAPDQPSISVDDVSIVEGTGGTAEAVFTVSVSGMVTRPVTVGYATADGSAAAGTDYQAVSGTLAFLPTTGTRTVGVPVTGDAMDEPNESFSVVLSNPVNATITDGTGTGAILDDDNAPLASIADASVIEGDQGITALDFTILLSAPSGKSLSVCGRVSVDAGDTAIWRWDFEGRFIFHTFAPGTTARTVTVAVNADTFAERADTLTAFIEPCFGSPVGIADDRAVGTILNDDGPLTSDIPLLIRNDNVLAQFGVSEGFPVGFDLILDRPAESGSGVSYRTADGGEEGPPATALFDYEPAAGSLLFASGEQTKKVTVQTIDDQDCDPVVPEEFFVELFNPVNALLVTDHAAGYIAEDPWDCEF